MSILRACLVAGISLGPCGAVSEAEAPPEAEAMLSAYVEMMAEETLCDLESTCDPEELDLAQLSEAYGHFIGQHLIGADLPLDTECMIRGVRLALSGFPSPMNPKEFDFSLTLLRERVFGRLAQENLAEAECFLTENASVEGVEELLPGRLQMRIEAPGEGPAVAMEDIPTIHYRCHYLDGTPFGASSEGDPVSLPLEQTIPGFREGIVGMKEGERRTLFIHPELAYGTADRQKPNCLLILEVQLIKATVVDHLSDASTAESVS